MAKLIIVILLLVIIFNLFKALFVMTRNDPNQQMSKRLGKRLIFSVLTLIFILVMVKLGFITPHQTPY